MTKATFCLCKNIDSRELRYILHKLEGIKIIDAERLKKAIEVKKRYKKRIVLTDKEKEIVERFGKATGLLLNYVLVNEDEGERA
ncbi:conserved hypothetical protein [Methanocaldococcus sp. FS406-22]|uniref:DUF2540 domain-containing protein n=1 Tax=Methanocaldococcus sp. (strain FS406-22) TaxID=644281 RepID=UPI0001BF351C|nr:DUF2540 domain-containing protein [Methanocaldococcus sp. FS406-22]ADC69780.1 conserved hypothetical protein [Methanocaldococcus sp. FS406-22]